VNCRKVAGAMVAGPLGMQAKESLLNRPLDMMVALDVEMGMVKGLVSRQEFDRGGAQTGLVPAG